MLHKVRRGCAAEERIKLPREQRDDSIQQHKQNFMQADELVTIASAISI